MSGENNVINHLLKHHCHEGLVTGKEHDKCRDGHEFQVDFCHTQHEIAVDARLVRNTTLFDQVHQTQVLPLLAQLNFCKPLELDVALGRH